MGLDREIAAMRRRLNKVVPVISPPELKLSIIAASDPVPEPSPWQMVIRIEDKDPAFNS